jgi:CRP-like cAMP-binding protein
MADFNPAVLRRMLFLRQCALFGSADLDELATIAENVISARYPAGSLVTPAGAHLTALQFIVEGSIETDDGRWGPRQVFGALEIAASRHLAAPAIATTPTHVLELSAADFGEVLEDNFGVLLSVLRELASQMLELGPGSIRRRHALPRVGSLGLVERLLVLRQVMPFAGARVQALARLAHDSEEVRFPAGAVLGDDQPLDGGLVIVEGTARAVGHRDVGPGDSLGFLETLAGRPFAHPWTTVTDVRALRTSGSVLLDVLEDHTDIGLALVAGFSSVLLDRRATN